MAAGRTSPPAPPATTPIGAREAARLFAPFRSGPVALAVSGGGDSTASMVLFAEARALSGAGLSGVTVLSVDHGLRAEAADEIAKAAALARRLGLAHRTLSWRGEKPVSAIQERARFARLDLMSQWCVANAVARLVLAHTLDDQAETFLMRLARSGSPDALSGISRRSFWTGIALHRPLLAVPGARLRASLEARGLGWSDDPSNTDPRFERVRLRRLMPALAGEGLDAPALAAAAERFGAQRLALDEAADAAARRVLDLHQGGFCRIDLDGFTQEAAPIARRLVKRVCLAIGGGRYPPQTDEIARLQRWIVEGGGAARTLAACLFRRTKDRLLVTREHGRAGFPEMPLTPGERVVWDRRFHVAATGGAPLVLRALGSDGLRQMRARKGKPGRIPAAALLAMPSLWRDGAGPGGENTLLAAPAAGLEGAGASAEFCNRALLFGGVAGGDGDG